MSGSEIFLFRHGETEWNASGRIQGSLDSPLTARGVAQAEDIGRRLAPIAATFDAVAVSPLGRARQTWEIVRSFAGFPEAQLDERLRELSLGSWDGLTQIDIEAGWPGHLDGSTRWNWFFRSPDGESYAHAAARAADWLSDCRTSGQTVLAVTHGLMRRIVRGAYLGLEQEEALRLPVTQGAIWHFADGSVGEFEGGRQGP